MNPKTRNIVETLIKSGELKPTLKLKSVLTILAGTPVTEYKIKTDAKTRQDLGARRYGKGTKREFDTKKVIEIKLKNLS